MSDFLLLKSQMNQAYELIKRYNLDLFNFKWEQSLSKFTQTGVHPVRVSRLCYEGSGFSFQFDFADGRHPIAIYSTGSDRLVEERTAESWLSQLAYVGEWLRYLKREVEEPDLWAELARYKLPHGEQVSAETGNEPFTFQQVSQITEGIKNIRAYLEATVHLDEQQRAMVNEKLDYLVGAAKRQGRRDWLHTSIGVVFTLATALAFSPEQANTIWGILKAAVSGIIQFIPIILYQYKARLFISSQLLINFLTCIL